MKITIRILTISLILSACHSVSQTNVSYHPIVKRAMETSLYTEDVNWEKVNQQFTELSKDSTNINEALQFLVNSLGDKHATFRLWTDQSLLVYYTGERESREGLSSSFFNEVINDITAKFEYKKLENEVGYLKVVGIAPGKVEENSKLIRDGLIELKNLGVHKWIVDLRYNAGGDMNPMIAGLAPLIGEGFIGGSVDNKDNMHHEYMITNGQFYDNERLVTEINNEPTIASDEKVVVLLSKYTISSGELTAVAFKGRSHTYFIGENTAGYTTGNGWEQVTDQLLMCISESVFIDRNRVKYENYVGVDETIPFEEYVQMQDDQQIKRAIEWLKSTKE